MIQRQIPIAEQVTTTLHRRILEGVYAPNDRLPSESELAAEMGVSRGSIRTALTTLATAGLIDRRQGDGTYVRHLDSYQNSLIHTIWAFTRLIGASGRQPSIRPLSIDRRLPIPQESATLRIRPNEEVICVQRLFYADEQPVILSINVSPATIFTVEIEELDATWGIDEFLKRFCNREIASADLEICATLADDRVQEALGLAPHAAILCTEQVFRDLEGCPLVLAVNYHGGNKLSVHDVRPWHSWSRI